MAKDEKGGRPPPQYALHVDPSIDSPPPPPPLLANLPAQGRRVIDFLGGKPGAASSSDRNVFQRRRRCVIEIGRSLSSRVIYVFQDCHRDSLQKRRVAENPSSSPANAFWQRKQMTDSTSIDQWMANRKKKLLQHQGCDAVEQRLFLCRIRRILSCVAISDGPSPISHHKCWIIFMTHYASYRRRHRAQILAQDLSYGVSLTWKQISL